MTTTNMLQSSQPNPPRQEDADRADVPTDVAGLSSRVSGSPRRVWGALRANSRFVRGFSASLVLRLAEVGLMFLVTVVFARLLGKETFGRYIYSVSWIGTLVILGVMGFYAASMRFVAVYSNARQWGMLRGYLRFSLSTVWVLSVLVTCVYWVVVWLLRGYMPVSLFHALLTAGLILPPMALMQLKTGVSRGFGHLVQAQLPQAVVVPAILLIGIGLLYFGPAGPRDVPAWQTLLLHAGALCVALAILDWGVRRSIPERVASAEIELQRSEWFKVASRLSLVSGLVRLQSYVDVLMLGLIAGTTVAGIYAMASRIASLLVFILNAGNIVLNPMVAKAHHEGDREELQRLLGFAARVMLVLSIPSAIVIGLFGKMILGLLGSDFSVGYVPLLILLGGQFVCNAAGPAGVALGMTGHESSMARAFTASVIVNIILNALLIPWYGATGAAVATVSAVVVSRLLLTFMAWHHLGIVVCGMPRTNRQDI